MENEKLENLEAQITSLTSRVLELEQKVAILSGDTEKTAKLLQQGKTDIAEQTIGNIPLQNRLEESNSSDIDAQKESLVNSPQSSNISQGDTENLESKIGKKLMSVAASILVIFSVILFGRLLYPALTDSVKVFLMYALSLIFSGIGISKLNASSKYQTLYASFAACGVSSIYISSLLACFYFRLFPVNVLMMILLAWLVLTGALAKLKSRMFLYIYNVGLLIASSITFSYMYPAMGTFLYYIGLIILFVTNKSGIYTKDCYFFKQLHLMSIIYLLCNSHSLGISMAIAMLNLITFVLAHYLYEKATKTDTYLSMSNQIAMSIGFAIMLCFGPFETQPYQFTIIAFINAILTIIQYCKYKDKNQDVWLVSFYVTSFVTILGNKGFIAENLSFIPICILLLVLEYYIKNNHFKYSSVVFAILTNYYEPEKHPFAVILIFTLLFIGYYAFRYFKKSYYLFDKFLLCYLFFLSLIKNFNEYNVTAFIVFTILSLLSIFINSALFRMNYETMEEEITTTVISYLYNAIILIWGLILTLSHTRSYYFSESFSLSSSAVAAIIIALTIMLSLLNVKHLYNSNKSKTFIGIYTCTKLLIVLLAILYRLETVSLVVSLATLIFAVLCIAFGFKINVKSFRLYGLTLTLILVLKLILYDISYDSAILRPLGFLGAGLLCYGVSWLYSKLEKQIVN